MKKFEKSESSGNNLLNIVKEVENGIYEFVYSNDNISNEEDLKKLLESYKVEKLNTQKLKSLYEEIKLGECKLFSYNKEIYRLIYFIMGYVYIVNENGSILGRIVEKSKKIKRLSEKMREGENINDTVKRLIKEELGMESEVEIVNNFEGETLSPFKVIVKTEERDNTIIHYDEYNYSIEKGKYNIYTIKRLKGVFAVCIFVKEDQLNDIIQTISKKSDTNLEFIEWDHRASSLHTINDIKLEKF
ncbi:hypothetical protein HRbin34_00464 [bacterium HR34]|nr:hypothetical protein HRbin34_00464 [bacterium HR34]